MKKSCHNCQDYIVCYGYDEIKIDKGENCPDWHLDFMTFQEIHENKKPTNEAIIITQETWDKIINESRNNSRHGADPYGRKDK